MNVLFIHGAGCTGEVFEAQLRAFADSSAPNLPGHLCPGEPASIAEFADAVSAAAESSDERVVLCGHSMGGAITLEAALRKPAWLAGAIVIGSGARMAVAPAFLDGLEHDFENTARTLAGYFFADASVERIEQALEVMRRVGHAQTLRDFRACNAFDVRDRVQDVAVPLLALTGEQDRMMPPKSAESLSSRVPGAQARIVSGAGHFVMAERPAETNQAIEAFLAGLS